MAFTQIEAAGITSTSTVVLQNATVAGVITATSGFVGNLTGSVTGGLTGNVTGTATTSLASSTTYAISGTPSINVSGIGINTTSPKSSLDLSQSTNAVALPQGTTAQRPTGNNPYIRYNTTNSALEFYNGTDWVEIISDYFPSGSVILG